VLAVITALVVWWPAGVAMIMLAALLVLLLRRRLRALVPLRFAEEEAWSDVAAVTEESIHGQDDVRTSLARPYVLRLFARRSSELLARGRRVWRLSGRVSVISSSVVRAAVIGTAVAGAYLLSTGRADAAAITAVWLLSLSFCATAEHLSRLIPELQIALGSWQRVEQLRGSKQEPVGGAQPYGGDIEIRGLTFRYADAEPASGQGSEQGAVLRDVSLTFHRGRS
jgi:ABC-type multidrug transport system fused ATPase/permease subunit